MRSFPEGYDELRLRVDHREQGSYHVHASTRSAEASASFQMPFSELEIENFILRVSRPRGRRRIDSSALGDAKRFGGALFQALFRERVYGLYHDALAEARSGGRGLRITLCLSDSPDLIDVPWEYLFDEPHFLAVSAFTPVVRYLDLPRAYRPLRVQPPLRLLGVVSSPAEYEQLDVERERENLRHALSELSEAAAIELRWLERPTLGGLLRALQTDTFHAVHYIGHGAFPQDAGQGVLLFEDDSGWARPVSGEKLGMILHDFSSLRLAVLNACEGARAARTDPFAGVAGSLVQRDIPAVIAMQFEISDEAAIVFAEGFYRAIALGWPVDAALAAARLAMLAERSDDIEWGTPVLFMRVPDGRIFDVREQPALLPETSARAVDARSHTRAVAAERRGARYMDALPTVATGEGTPAGAERGAPGQTQARAAAPSPGRDPARESPQRVTPALGSPIKLRRTRTGATSVVVYRSGGPLRRYRWPALGLLLLACAAVAAIIVLTSGGASAGPAQVFEAVLNPILINHVEAGASGTASIRLQGDAATVTVDATGLLNGSPHLMHIHAFGKGTCPPASAARLYNGHRAINAHDGNPYYGMMAVALTETGGTTAMGNMTAYSRYPSSGNIHYRPRTITVSAAVAGAIRHNDAVIVVHGIDYNHNGRYDNVLGPSDLDYGVPQEETDPGLCGPLHPQFLG